MKYLLFIPFALLLGLAAGSWVPRKELAELRTENRSLKKELESSGRSGKLSALNSIIKIPGNTGGGRTHHAESETPEAAPDKPVQAPAEITNANAAAHSPTNTAPSENRRKRRRIMPDPNSKNFEAELKEAKELWQTRVQMARSQWLSKLELDTERTALFDEAFAEMNEKLYLTMQLVADELNAGSEMTNEAGLRIVNEVTTTLVETYDQLDKVVPPERRNELETMEMQDFIDPAAFEPLINVRDKLR